MLDVTAVCLFSVASYCSPGANSGERLLSTMRLCMVGERTVRMVPVLQWGEQFPQEDLKALATSWDKCTPEDLGSFWPGIASKSFMPVWFQALHFGCRVVG